jgi:DNA-binding SARP family transcriptional activator/predicted negative regulator of RcsB-dependent stress response
LEGLVGVEFRILGPVEVWDGGQWLVPGGPRPRALLAVLLVHANQVVSTDRLIDQLWGEAPPATARTVVQGYVSQLRQTLHRCGDGSAAGQVLLTRPPGYLLRVEAGELDLDRFEELGAQARRAAADGDLERAAQRWRAALALWRGPPLDGVASEALRRGAVPRLEEARLVALEERLEVDLGLGRHAELVGELETLVTEHPLRERLRRQLMLALYRSGRPAEALAVYHSTRQVLVEELGLEPSPAMQELERAILLADPALEPTLQTAVEALGQPVSPPWPYQLPPDIDDFTGREAAAAEVQQLLEAAQATAVVISAIAGKAGVGKTALAVHVAHRLRSSYPDGQLYVNLQGAEAQARDPTEVLAGFLRALGVEGGVIAEGLEERVRQYRSRLADRRVLVVLDDAASEAQVRPLLPGSGGCGALVTSRSRLSGLEAAHPLALDVLEPDQAVALLGKLTGPGRVAAEPEAAQAIVRLCGWLPLAVRIAGARLASRPHWRVALLAERLADEWRRLDELRAGDLEVRASVALSYQGRREQERRLFRRLGLLVAPSFPAWVAATLLEVEPADAEGLLERLVDAQLVEAAGEDQAGQLRYRLHDLLRVFARERLHAEEPTAAQRASLERVLQAYLTLTERAEALLVPSGVFRYGDHPASRPQVDHPAVAIVNRDPLRWFEAERASLVAAVEHGCEASLGELGWRLAETLIGFFQLHAYWEDWGHTHILALAAARRAGDRDAQARVLVGLGDLHTHQDRFDDAISCLQRSLATFRETGNRRGELQSLLVLGAVDKRKGRFDDAIARLEQSLAGFQELGARSWEALALFYLGDVNVQRGRLDAAMDYLSQSLLLVRAVADGPWEAAILRRLGLTHSARGRFDEAIVCLQRSLALVRAASDRPGEAYVLESLGEVYCTQGSLQDAAGCLEQSLALAHAVGDGPAEALSLHTLGEVYREQGDLDTAAGYLERSLAMFRDFGYRHWEARALDRLGLLLAAKGDWAAACSAWRAALVIFRELGMPEAAEVAARLAEPPTLATRRASPRPPPAGLRGRGRGIG